MKTRYEEATTCCICHEPIEGHGNNPAPVVEAEGDRCCDRCNFRIVLPARMDLMYANK